MTIISSGTYEPDFAKDAWKSMQTYADSIGAKFLKVLELPREHPYRNQFKTIIKNVTDPEELVLWFDWDITIRNNAPNLFDFYTEENSITWFEHEFWPADKSKWPDGANYFEVGKDIRKRVPELTGKKYMTVAIMLGKQKTFAKLDSLMSDEILSIGMQHTYAPASWEVSVNIAIDRSDIINKSFPTGMHVPVEIKDRGFFAHKIGVFKFLKQ